eukprot:CAMPEP_0170554380 /NCGR_PEP_ID=MMETSP0211-20121228/12213_1 /TAXON_ID=311385 /ORGANISM="Pseudokeronopsis sp., Strain OXSARD2" /LENGTH=87 /DNA_ID=CAMNT_0010863363 /DNA_START=61 /DNA_END=324 /DNA_ORIENTATION=+
MPGIEVFTRRDRDGFPLVKVKMQVDYKYKLKDIMEYDPEKEKELVKETQELVLKGLLGENPDRESIEKLILPKEREYDMDFESKRRA